MLTNELISGEQGSWRLLRKLGEGDAGEVYLVESLLEKRQAILKRPVRSSFPSDIIRQASQIVNEGKILRALSGLASGGGTRRVNTPALLDQAKSGSEFSDRAFIVIERARGFDLNFFARAARFGEVDSLPLADSISSGEQRFLAALTQRGGIPAPIVLRTMSCLLDFIERIHTLSSMLDGSEKSGILWNDIKAEHIFWDPARACITIIDWGNAQFLEGDGATKDRHFSRTDDYTQFIQEMGKFVSLANQELYDLLEWPGSKGPVMVYPEAARELKERLKNQAEIEMSSLNAARQGEAALLRETHPSQETLQELQIYQQQIINLGELPDEAVEKRLISQLANHLASSGSWEEYIKLCEAASQKPGADPISWQMLAQMAVPASQNQGAVQHTAHLAIQAGLQGDWPEAYWLLAQASARQHSGDWWPAISQKLRVMVLGDTANQPTPYTLAQRSAHTLRDLTQRLEAAGEGTAPEEALASQKEALRMLKQEVLANWREMEPDPPHSGLEYSDLNPLLEALASIQPESKASLESALTAPRTLARQAIEAWRHKEFTSVLNVLRRMLLADPERLRVLMAELAVLRAPAWLDRAHQGPQSGDSLLDFMTQIELDGRELRNQVGPARWLDLMLEALGGLRNGANPADLLLAHPELLNDLPWLNEYESRRPAPAVRSAPVRLERVLADASPSVSLPHQRTGQLGENGDLLLGDSLDTWAPEARGSSARVFNGMLRSDRKDEHYVAVKLMRPDRAEYALPLFREEVQILTLMRDVPGVTPMLECGFITPTSENDLPGDDRQASARGLRGELQRFGPGEVREFLGTLEAQVSQGKIPYLTMERRSREENLLVLCDAGYTHGRFLPLAEGLRMAIQICDVLQVAHARNILYLDHKILHYYWMEAENGIYLIDWNVARRLPQGLSSADRQFDLVQFGARALHHILTGRPAPGALPLGPTRPDEIDHAARTYAARWTYDDQRLPTDLRTILERVLSGGYDDVKILRQDMLNLFLQLPDTEARNP